MKKQFLYAALFAFAMASCSDQDMLEQPSTPTGGTEVQLPADFNSGELLIKFKPEMTDILDRALTRAASSNGIMTRSGIPSTDEVLEILGGYHFERIFPVDPKNEGRTRTSGLHLWYRVKFDENTDVQEAANRLARLGEISKVQGNKRIRRAYNTKAHRTYVNPTALQQKAVTRAEATGNAPFNDPGLEYQWHINNIGGISFDAKNELPTSAAGCDVGCFEAWQMCKGDPSIIVAVLDEGVMNTHPDLRDNIWINDGENGNDEDGNGYKNDKYGYNFVDNSGIISWSDASDTGHGTHVAGIIAACNGNGEGVCGIAGGDGGANSGVKIMSCQVFSGANSVNLDAEARAIKYAADNGAVILQCSWGYNSSDANIVEGYTPGPATQKEWEETYPLEKDALDYFIHNAGSPNGVIDGGIAIFAAGNEYAGAAGFPGAYDKCISVSSVAADFTPASYSNYGLEVGICAPGGDTEYHNTLGVSDPEFWRADAPVRSGSILSTLINNGEYAYGYMDGTSMACPAVSGVAALGLSYAVQQRRHFKAAEFIALMKETADASIFNTYVGRKVYHRNHIAPAPSATQMELSKYRDKMGAGLADAAELLRKIGGGSGSDMKLPNVYVAENATSVINLARYFFDGENLNYTCTSSNEAVATVTLKDKVMEVSGVKTGTAHITVKVSNGQEQTIAVTVRKTANDNGWM